MSCGSSPNLTSIHQHTSSHVVTATFCVAQHLVGVVSNASCHQYTDVFVTLMIMAMWMIWLCSPNASKTNWVAAAANFIEGGNSLLFTFLVHKVWLYLLYWLKYQLEGFHRMINGRVFHVITCRSIYKHSKHNSIDFYETCYRHILTVHFLTTPANDDHVASRVTKGRCVRQVERYNQFSFVRIVFLRNDHETADFRKSQETITIECPKRTTHKRRCSPIAGQDRCRSDDSTQFNRGEPPWLQWQLVHPWP